jgi:crotonobetaine/carnitine-CoA ligase
VIPFIWNALKTLPVPPESRYRTWGSPLCDPPHDPYFGVKSVGWWGMTETITHPIVGSALLPDPPMSMGRAHPAYQVSILDHAMRPVKPGEEGDLYIGGVPGLSLFAEYMNDPIATRDAFTPDGLFITGDRVRLGESGEIYFSDRSKDMLKVAGENVAASEVERAIMETGLVSEAAVVGRPDSMRGQVPVAFVIPLQGGGEEIGETILSHCRKRLAAFKVPEAIRVVEQLPRSTLNKIAKNELRALFIDGASS